MPYNHEFATNKANQQLMASSGIKEMLKVVQFIISDIEFERLDSCVIEKKNKIDSEKLKYVFVIDGSKQETAVTEGSHARLCLFNINQCAIDIKNLLGYLQEKFPLPKQYQTIKEDVAMNYFLPIKGMRTAEHADEKDFFRNSLYHNFKRLNNPMEQWMSEHGYKIEKMESLLDTYLYLVGKIDYIKNAPHPCPDCRKAGRALTVKSFKKESAGNINHTSNNWHSSIQCGCNTNSKTVYPTDLLGFHEQLNNETSNEALTTQIMLVTERITLINLLRNIVNNNIEELIEKACFIVDGALAVYSHASWLSQAINKELADIKHQYPVLVLGVEKTGNFVDHFKTVNSHFSIDPLKPGMLFFLEDQYIKNHVKVYDNAGFYGENNYFGKKLFYKNKNGKLFVINVAFENEADRVVHMNARNTQEYRDGVIRLMDIVDILDNFSSQNYENALSLISLANEGAALSSSYLGKKLLNDYVKDMLNIK